MTTFIDKAWTEKHPSSQFALNFTAGIKDRSATNIIKYLIDNEKYDWVNWEVERLLGHGNAVRWAIFCAEQVLPIFEKQYPDDARPRAAIEAAKTWLENPTEENRLACVAAGNAANAASNAASYAAYAAYNAAYAAYAANAANAAGYAANAASNEMRARCYAEGLRLLGEQEAA